MTLEVPGARIMRTRFFLEALERVDYLVEYRKMGLFWGPAGCGKTTAGWAAREVRGERALSVTLDGNPTPRSIANELLKELTGVAHNETRFKARDHLIERLQDRDEIPLLMFDELHLSKSIENIEFIRGIHMRLGAPVLLVSDPGVKKRLDSSAQTSRRIHRPLWFGPLPPDDVLQIIPHWHPLFADAEPELIQFIDETMCQGNLGTWSKFTVDAVHETKRRGSPLTMEIAVAVIAGYQGPAAQTG